MDDEDPVVERRYNVAAADDEDPVVERASATADKRGDPDKVHDWTERKYQTPNVHANISI